MHIRVMLLEPLLALLRRATELAVLGLAHQPVVFSGRFEPTERSWDASTSGGREHTEEHVSADGRFAEGKGMGGCTAAVNDMSGLGLRRRRICRGCCFGHYV